jgi:hypothetical protein
LILDSGLDDAEIILWNYQGIVVRRMSHINGTEVSIERNGLLDGVYILQVKEGASTLFTTKVIFAE